MKIKLDDIDLIKRIDDDGLIKELRNIVNLSVSGKRNIVELKIPGSEGSIFQDLGRDPLKISFDGNLVGPDTMKTLEELKAKFTLGKEVPFSSDISTLSDISEVVIENFSATFKNTAPSGSRYSMVLREHNPEMGPGETRPPSQQETAEKEVRDKIGRIFSDIESKPG